MLKQHDQSEHHTTTHNNEDLEDNQENLMSNPTLGYWNIRGLGAQIRALLYFCGVQFHDKRYNAFYDEASQSWDRSEWLNEKENLGMEFPNLPYLFDEDVKITETLGIMQYVAKKWKPELLGRNAAEVGRIKMLEKHVFDLKMQSAMPCYAPDGNAENIVNAVRPLLAKIYAVSCNSAYLCGDNITYLDFAYHELLEVLSWMSSGSFLEEFPNLKGYCERMVGHYNAQFWQENNTLLFNGPMATVNNYPQ